MEVRRVVTGHSEEGRSVFISDEIAPRAKSFQDIPGYGMAQIWATDPESEGGADLSSMSGSLIPGPGGTSLLMISLPPDSIMAAPTNPQRALAEMMESLPGLIDHFEPENPGMHCTPTLDYGVVLEGEVWLELDDGEQRLLRAGDVVIQQATRHAWRNRSPKPVKALFFMIGARSVNG